MTITILIKSKEDYERQVAEWTPYLQLIGKHRLGSIALNAVLYKLDLLNDSWFTFNLLSVKTPRLIHKLSSAMRSIPPEGGTQLTMRRYTPTTDWKDQLKEKYEEVK